jgi:hypothetical protein
MSTNAKDIRTKSGFSLPCPECGAACRPDDVTNRQERRVIDAFGNTAVLPFHYLDLTCDTCHLQLWIALDEDGKPLDVP